MPCRGQLCVSLDERAQCVGNLVQRNPATSSSLPARFSGMSERVRPSAGRGKRSRHAVSPELNIGQACITTAAAANSRGCPRGRGRCRTRHFGADQRPGVGHGEPALAGSSGTRRDVPTATHRSRGFAPVLWLRRAVGLHHRTLSEAPATWDSAGLRCRRAGARPRSRPLRHACLGCARQVRSP